MPIQKIEVSEYLCVHCGYRWINRMNGQDGPIPKNCAKCKRKYWDGPAQKYPPGNPISPKERGLRVRLCRHEGYDPRKGTPFGGSTSYWPNELCKKFLGLKPRPTLKELSLALYPFGYNVSKYKNRIPDPDKPGYLKYVRSGKEYEALIKLEIVKRREIMTQIIESRGKQTN